MDKSLTAVIICVIIAALTVASAAVIVSNNTDDGDNMMVKPILPKDTQLVVVGHVNPDSDTVCSSVAMANLLCSIGYDAKPYLTGDLNFETEYILQRFGIDAPEKISDVTGKNVVMTDHNDPVQGVYGESEAKICMIVDHHSLSAHISDIAEVYIRPIGSTCTLVTSLYEQYGVAIPKDVAMLLLAGILSDTKGEKSPTYTEIDRIAVDKLVKITDVDKYDLYTGMMNSKSKILEGSDEDLYKSSLKDYSISGTTYSIGLFDCASDECLQEAKARMKSYISENFNSLGKDMIFYMFVDLDDECTELIYFGEHSEDVVSKAFGQTGDIVLEGVTSRKAQVNPPIEDAIRSIVN